MCDLKPERQAIVSLVRDWVDREVTSVVRELEHANTAVVTTGQAFR